MADSPCLGPSPLICMSRAVFCTHILCSFVFSIFFSKIQARFKILSERCKNTQTRRLRLGKKAKYKKNWYSFVSLDQVVNEAKGFLEKSKFKLETNTFYGSRVSVTKKKRNIKMQTFEKLVSFPLPFLKRFFSYWQCKLFFIVFQVSTLAFKI